MLSHGAVNFEHRPHAPGQSIVYLFFLSLFRDGTIVKDGTISSNWEMPFRSQEYKKELQCTIFTSEYCKN